MNIARLIRRDIIRKYYHKNDTIIKESDVSLRIRGIIHCEISKRVQYREIEHYVLDRMFEAYKEQHSLKPREQMLLEIKLNGIFKYTPFFGVYILYLRLLVKNIQLKNH